MRTNPRIFKISRITDVLGSEAKQWSSRWIILLPLFALALSGCTLPERTGHGSLFKCDRNGGQEEREAC